MRQSMLHGYALTKMDPYYNDAICLQKSLGEILNAKNPEINYFSGLIEEEMSELNLSTRLKYKLWISYFQVDFKNFQQYL